MDFDVITLSRLQFALTAMYHFLFVPLTLGLSWMLAIMESAYVMTGRDIWKQMTRFWGVLFGINFAMGVATGVTMEFQFGTNWAYYSHYVGDIFGAPLAIEGLMAFFLEATFVGLFFLGWNKLSKGEHLAVTWLVALGTNFSALWILIANGWMQNPVGTIFNPDTMRMEITSLYEVIFNPVAQAKFVHTVSAGYVVGAMFVLSISAWYLLKGRNTAFAQRSFVVAASFGLASALSVVVLGDESGYTVTESQKMKIAAIEAMWNTEPAPAPFTVVGFPDMAAKTNHAEVQIPWLLGLIATRSLDTEVPGINNLVVSAEGRIRHGLVAYRALQTYKADRSNTAARDAVVAGSRDLGYALLLKKFVDDPLQATEANIQQAAEYTIPNVPVLFWTFRIMVAIGVFLIALFGFAFWTASKRQFTRHPRFLRLCLYSLPLPWIAIQLGWLVAEYGRQPWAIDGVLPTALGVSSISLTQIWTSLIGFVALYSALAVVDAYMMVKYTRLGPDGLGIISKK